MPTRRQWNILVIKNIKKMKKIFIVICVFFPLFLNAQVKGTTTPVTQSVKATQLSDNATLDALAKEIAEKRSEIKALKDSITHI